MYEIRANDDGTSRILMDGVCMVGHVTPAEAIATVRRELAVVLTDRVFAAERDAISDLRTRHRTLKQLEECPRSASEQRDDEVARRRLRADAELLRSRFSWDGDSPHPCLREPLPQEEIDDAYAAHVTVS